MSPKRVARALAMIGSAVFVVILIVTVRVVHHRSQAQASKLAKAGTAAPDALLHAHSFHWTQIKGDQSQWVLKARDASYSADRTGVTLADAQLSLTARDGKSFQLSAPTATITLHGNHVDRASLGGGLTVHYGDFQLTTRDAVFSPDSDSLDAPGPVTIEGEGLTVNGIGLSGNPKAQVFHLQKQVTTRIVPRAKSAAAKPS
jgi:LPS export ABC transporter protein LptC